MYYAMFSQYFSTQMVDKFSVIVPCLVNILVQKRLINSAPLYTLMVFMHDSNCVLTYKMKC